jgi:hypothetical protein
VRLGRIENEFKLWWFDTPALPAFVDGNWVKVSVQDYSLFKLFHLSVFWRACISKRFGPFDLGPYSDKIRALLLSGSQGHSEHFPIYGNVILGDDHRVLFELVSKPHLFKQSNACIYTMCYAGVEWFLGMTDHPSKDLTEYAQNFCDGKTIIFPTVHYLQTYNARFLFSRVKNTGPTPFSDGLLA